jgi:hypothetical protein
MTSAETVAGARRLLTDGFVISAANVLVDDARETARVALEPPGGDAVPAESRRNALINALDLAIAKLQQHRDAIRELSGETCGAPPSVDDLSPPAKNGGRKKG